MDHLRIDSKGKQMPGEFKDSYVEKIASLEAGFFKTVEKVSSGLTLSLQEISGELILLLFSIASYP